MKDVKNGVSTGAYGQGVGASGLKLNRRRQNERMGDMTKLKIAVMNYWTSFRSFLNKRDRHKIHKMDKIGQQNKLLKKMLVF